MCDKKIICWLLWRVTDGWLLKWDFGEILHGFIFFIELKQICGTQNNINKTLFWKKSWKNLEARNFKSFPKSRN